MMTNNNNIEGSDLVYARHNERFLDKGDPGVGIESEKLLHLFTVGYLREDTKLLEKKAECI